MLRKRKCAEGCTRGGRTSAAGRTAAPDGERRQSGGEQAHQAVAVARIVGPRQRLGEPFQRGDGVAGAEAVHMRQHGADPARPRRETVPAQQRVEPDQAPARTGAGAPSRAPEPAGSSRSRPSVISSTTAPCPITRRDQSRLKACRQAPMRVPPSQSCASAPRRPARHRRRGCADGG